MAQQTSNKDRMNNKSLSYVKFYNKRNPQFIANSQHIQDIEIPDFTKQHLRINSGEVFTARSKQQTDSLQQSVERLNDILGGNFTSKKITSKTG
jgi:hypothetical protein